MSTTLSKIIGMGLFFLFTFASGFWLSRSGKPYSSLVFNLHKLIGLAAGIFLIVTMVRAGQAAALCPVEITALAVAILVFVGLVATGGLLSVFDSGGLTSASQAVRTAVKIVHHLFPYLAVLATAATLYLLLKRTV